MKTDKLFYRMLLSGPEMVSELMPGIAIDWKYEYKAPVVKEKEFRLDGVLLPLSEDMAVPVVFCEAQMQRDDRFYGRYFAELHAYLYQYDVKRPWQGLLILQSRDQVLGCEVPHTDLLYGKVTRLYLEDLLPLENLTPNLALLRLITVPEKDVEKDARALLRSMEGTEGFGRHLDLVEGILISKFPLLTVEEVRRMLDVQLADLSDTVFYQEVSMQGEAKLALRLLARRCGALSKVQEAQVRSLSSAKIEQLGDVLLDFEGMADLEVWLTENVEN
jgi:predicted transposase YdaD